jgi:hypothetical protein
MVRYIMLHEDTDDEGNVLYSSIYVQAHNIVQIGQLFLYRHAVHLTGEHHR